MTEKTINERLKDVESKLDLLLYKRKPAEEISQHDFITIYDKIVKLLPPQNLLPHVIWIDECFADCLKHKVLYPNYDEGFWYPIGKEEKLPVGFKDMEVDVCIDCSLVGNFPEKKGGIYE